MFYLSNILNVVFKKYHLALCHLWIKKKIFMEMMPFFHYTHVDREH